MMMTMMLLVRCHRVQDSSIRAGQHKAWQSPPGVKITEPFKSIAGVNIRRRSIQDQRYPFFKELPCPSH